MADLQALGRAYLQHLTDDDLALLARARPPAPPGGPAELRPDPCRVVAYLEQPEAAAAVLAAGPDPGEVLPVSPFLLFAAAVHATAAELGQATHVVEWLGPRHRAPVFDVAPLRDFLGDPWRRLFLAELLASYTRVASGSMVVATRRGLRRRRFSELDPARLVGLLEVVADVERPGVYRRLGDLALFLTGVFPDHTATHALSPVDRHRLLRSAGRPSSEAGSASWGVPGFGDAGAVGLLDQLGRRWYRLAHDLVPPQLRGALGVVGELPERFGDARRILNSLTERHLFGQRSRWFGVQG